MKRTTIRIAGHEFYEPTMRQRNGRYYIRYYDPNRNPKQIERALRTSDRRAAEHLFGERRSAYLYGGFDPWRHRRREGVTLSKAIAEYLKDPHIRASTRKCKRNRLEPLDWQFPGMLVSGVTEDMLRDHCLRSDLKRQTRLRYLYEFRKFLAFCQEQGWIEENPAAKLLKSIPRHVKRKKRGITEFLSADDVQRVLAALDFDIEEHPSRSGRIVLRDVIMLAVTTGLRRGELCNLRWADVGLFEPPRAAGTGLAYGWLKVRHDGNSLTKTGHEDRVPLVAQSHTVLVRRLAADPNGNYVFTGPRGGKLDGEWISSLFREYRRMAKLPEELHFHSLRHTCASWLVGNGINLKVVQEVMRHSKINQTLRYAHLAPDTLANQMASGFSSISLG